MKVRKGYKLVVDSPIIGDKVKGICTGTGWNHGERIAFINVLRRRKVIASTWCYYREIISAEPVRKGGK